jgi:NAD(P)-dependent dehydrogenase (short-subunit alcohol dehydrogenase family)
MAEPFDLAGKTAFVTGASSGLGRRFALTLSRAGAKVAVASRRVHLLEQLAEEIGQAGGQGLAIGLDVIQPAQVEAAVERANAELGPVAILVNSAGVMMQERIAEVPVADYDQMMDTNAKGSWLVARAVARRLIDARTGGCIINIASIAGITTIGQLGVYGASKSAVIQLTKAMALEWARYGINVNAICPGYIETPINAAFWRTEIGQSAIERFPRRRVGKPEDLDGILLLLASDASRFLTGAAIPVDDGQSLVI